MILTKILQLFNDALYLNKDFLFLHIHVSPDHIGFWKE